MPVLLKESGRPGSCAISTAAQQLTFPNRRLSRREASTGYQAAFLTEPAPGEMFHAGSGDLISSITISDFLAAHLWGPLQEISPLSWGAAIDLAPADRHRRRCVLCGVLQRADHQNNPCPGARPGRGSTSFDELGMCMIEEEPGQ